MPMKSQTFRPCVELGQVRKTAHYSESQVLPTIRCHVHGEWQYNYFPTQHNSKFCSQGWLHSVLAENFKTTGHLFVTLWRYSPFGISWGWGHGEVRGDCRHAFCSSQLRVTLKMRSGGTLRVSSLAQLVDRGVTVSNPWTQHSAEYCGRNWFSFCRLASRVLGGVSSSSSLTRPIQLGREKASNGCWTRNWHILQWFDTAHPIAPNWYFEQLHFVSRSKSSRATL